MGQKSVLITGSSEGGIGDDALARTFHKNGLRVFATARNLTKVQHLKELGLEILPLDVTDGASIKQAVESVKAATGGTLDILMFDVNVFALIAVTQAFSPLLIASKGTIVKIGSIVGKIPLPWQGYYNASKAAVNLLSDQLRIELSPFNVKVVNIVTGSVLTRFMENLASRLPPNSLYSPAKKEVEELMLGELALENAMKVEAYAEGVASNALKSNPKKIQWIGGETFLIWLGDTFANGKQDLILPRATNLGIVQRKIRTASQPISK
ncbi:putative short-chain dehydrogenase/reductase [Hyaloscypha finlandica]|nr:putative short-chain dehydrogenase/reductase [Hyaloscypha finlandica]